MRWFPGLNIRSKLILMLLIVSGVAIGVIAAVGYVSGRDSLEARVFDQLTSLRTSKANQITRYAETLRGHVEAMSEDLMVLDAVQDFTAGYDALDADALAPAADSTLRAYYRTVFLPRLVAEGVPVLEAYLPEAPAARALQHRYVATDPPPPGAEQPPASAGDAEAYAQAHRRYHPALRHVTEAFGYYDLFLIAPDGRIVYSVAKEVDFATSLTSGPYDASNLARAFADARQQKGTQYVSVADFAFYQPSHGKPEAFMATPLFDGARFVGVLAVQLSVDEINAIMTDGGRWAASGLGRTGEIFLVGRDDRVRSATRGFLEDTTAYAAALRAGGTDAATLRRITTHDTPILLQEARSEAVRRAQAGQDGVMRIAGNYLGHPALASYAPLSITGLDWTIVAEMELEEAFAPVYQFQRRVLISAVVLVLLITLAAMVLASLLLRPVRRFTRGARQISAGDYDVDLTTGTNDEFGEMGEAVTEMTHALRAQAAYAEAQRHDTEALLTRFLPDSLTHRLRDTALEDGDWTLAEEVENVSVVYASLAGYEAMMRQLDAEGIVGALGDLVSAIDEARTRFGVEKIRTHGDTYMAACGLSAPQLDHARRALDFAVELRAIVRRYSLERGGALGVRIGVAAGPVIAGIIGADKLAFDLWGTTVSEAVALNAQCPPDAIDVSATVRERLHDAYAFEPAAHGAHRLAAPQKQAASQAADS